MSKQKKEDREEELKKDESLNNGSLTDPLVGRYGTSITAGGLFKIRDDGGLTSDYLKENDRLLRADVSTLKLRSDDYLATSVAKSIYRPEATIHDQGITGASLLSQVNDPSAHLQTLKLFETPKISVDTNIVSLLPHDASQVTFFNNPTGAMTVDPFGITSASAALRHTEETDGEKIKKLHEEIEALKRESMEKRDEGNKEVEAKIESMEKQLEILTAQSSQQKNEEDISDIQRLEESREKFSHYLKNQPIQWFCVCRCRELIDTLDSVEKIEYWRSRFLNKDYPKCGKRITWNQFFLNPDHSITYAQAPTALPPIDNQSDKA